MYIYIYIYIYVYIYIWYDTLLAQEVKMVGIIYIYMIWYFARIIPIICAFLWFVVSKFYSYLLWLFLWRSTLASLSVKQPGRIHQTNSWRAHNCRTEHRLPWPCIMGFVARMRMDKIRNRSSLNKCCTIVYDDDTLSTMIESPDPRSRSQL